VIPNPVQRPLPGLTAALSPGRYVAGGRKLLLAVGRLCHQKGFDLLIRAFLALPDACADWSLVILGEGPDRAAIAAQFAAARLDDPVFLPGAVGNISAWYDAADLFVLPSRYEGFPTALGEAMSHGCPVVAYDCETGPRRMVRDGIDGYLVRPVGDTAALSAALTRLMTNDTRRLRLAARAPEILERYPIDGILGLWNDAFAACTRNDRDRAVSL
jgi:glycosyltransferase involved in cell wall biosynthesis